MFARTERLLLRPGWGEDAPALFTAIADEAIIDKLPGTPWPYREQDAEAFLLRDRAPDDLPELLIYARTRGAPRLVGGIALRETEDEDTAELDYWIARPCWGSGLRHRGGAGGGRHGARRAAAQVAALGAFPRQSGVGARAREARIRADRRDAASAGARYAAARSIA